MLEMKSDLFTFGGRDDNNQDTPLMYRLTCLDFSNNYWTIFEKLKIPRSYTVVLPVADCTLTTIPTAIPTTNLTTTTTQTTNINTTIMTTTTTSSKAQKFFSFAINNIFHASY